MCISVILSYILLILFMNFIYKLFISYKNRIVIKIGYFSTVNRTIEKQANVMLTDRPTFPRFPQFVLYFRGKLEVTFARRCFRDAINVYVPVESVCKATSSSFP